MAKGMGHKARAMRTSARGRNGNMAMEEVITAESMESQATTKPPQTKGGTKVSRDVGRVFCSRRVVAAEL